VIFQDLDWVPANHLQAEDRAYRMGQTERVTVEYMLANGTLDVFIADLLEAKLRLKMRWKPTMHRTGQF
jgi:SNF2 family DNA or RNA helicase